MPDGGGETAAPRRRRRWLVDVLGLAVVLTLFAGGLVALRASAGAGATRTPRPAATQARPAATVVASWPEAKRALDDQAAALLRGDEKAWLAAVDPRQPKLVAQYRRMFTNLRGLGVTSLTYNVRFPGLTQPGRPEVTAFPTVAYCLQRAVCPAFDLDQAPESQKLSSLQQKLSMTRRDGRYVITGAALLPGQSIQMLPWFGDLRFAQGKRVTVAAAPSQAKRLRAAVAAADEAAATADRYARLMHNPQERYRVYLAGKAEWQTWFQGHPVRYAIGQAPPVDLATMEVELLMPELEDEDLPGLLRHELGHVATLNGAEAWWKSGGADDWMVEGAAEYIAFAPRRATADTARAAAAAMKKPGTIAVPTLSSSASDEQVDRFYSLGHHAVSCLVSRYGEPAFFGFFTKVLWEGNGYDQASREAFGRPFAAVDEACVASIRHLAGRR